MAQAVSAEALIATHQLHWVRHVPRMDKDMQISKNYAIPRTEEWE